MSAAENVAIVQRALRAGDPLPRRTAGGIAALFARGCLGVAAVRGRGAAARGFSLIEVLVAVVILGIVIATSLAIYFDRQKRLVRAAETIAAFQAIANEAEVQRRIEFTAVRSRGSFVSVQGEDGEIDLGALASLPNVTTAVIVAEPTPVVKQVTLVVEWGEATPRRSAKMTMMRSFAGNQGRLGTL